MMSADTHKILVVDEIHAGVNFRRGGVADMSVGEDFVVGPWQDGNLQAWDKGVNKETFQESAEEYYMVTKKYTEESKNGNHK